MPNETLEDLVEKYLDCYRKGDSPNIDAFAKSHPEHSDELLEILPLLKDLEDIGKRNSTTDLSTLPDFDGSDYKLLDKIGIGGMGVVFKGLQLSLNRNVAIKILSNSLLSDQSQREQFENEAKIIAMLHHPNIVKILNAKCSKNCCYYAMELIDGKGLNQYKINDINKIAEIGIQVAKALSYAHSCGVLHRDIKPSNLLLDKLGQVHISDFGLASLNKKNKVSAKTGTIRYMAPETLSNGENSTLSDQYSFGVTLYEIVTHKPFVTASSQKELSEKIRNGRTPKLSIKDKDFSAIINKCISFKPTNRYKNMDEVAKDIQRFLNNEPVIARKYTPLEKYKLWQKRKPTAALFGSIACIFSTAFIIALIIGFIQTNTALKLAQKNAATADLTINKVFEYVQNQPPSTSGSILLNTLMPYYQEIAKQSSLPKNRLIEANKIVGIYAFRSGDYKLAEKSYKTLANLEKSAFALNQYALTLERQGKMQDAISIRQKVIDKFSNSENENDKFEVAKALLTFSNNNSYKLKALNILKTLLNENPNNPEYLFQYAKLLAENTKSSQNIDDANNKAISIFNNLAQKYPDNPEYGLAIIELMNKRLKYQKSFSSIDFDNLETALNQADKMLSKFPNTPKVVSSIVKLKKAYIRMLRRHGNMPQARKETENLLGRLELLFYNKETPDDAKECLIELQLNRLRLFVKDNRQTAIYDLTTKLDNEFKIYNGSRKEELLSLYNSIIK